MERTDLGNLGVRCILHPEYLTPVADTVAALRGLETTGRALFVGAIVGVPPEETSCNGFGETLAGCLDLESMTETVDPGDSGRPTAVCETAAGTPATPGVRFVELAQSLGHQAYISSICADDYGPALNAIARALY